MMVEQESSHEALRQLKRTACVFPSTTSNRLLLDVLPRAAPLDELKIDIMFVKSMLEAPQNAKIVRSLIDLAHNLELTVVAEGVENAEILAALKHLGCDIAQGFHIGRPMSVADMVARLHKEGGR